MKQFRCDSITQNVPLKKFGSTHDIAHLTAYLVSKKSEFITPVPGGVGPMTIACLLNNTVECFKKAHSK